jgi:hypothetical protein
MKTLKQLIIDEQRRQQAADERLRCFAINNFGAGKHAYADETSLQYFKAHYVKQCLRKCAASISVSQHARDRAKQLAES